MDWTKEHKLAGTAIIAVVCGAAGAGVTWAGMVGRIEALEDFRAQSTSHMAALEQSSNRIERTLEGMTVDMAWVKQALIRLEKQKP